VILYRSRGPLVLPEIELVAGKNSLALEFPPGWLDQHPLTQADLNNETERLKRVEFNLTVC